MMSYENDMMRILRESEKCNIMLLFTSEEEALSAASNFRKAMTKSIKDTRDKTVLQTAAGFHIYFKSIQFVKRGLDGIRAKVIICIPILEYISVHCGGVCTIKQFREQEVL